MKFNSIQMLRCVAVLAVVILHSGFSVKARLVWIPVLSDFGWIGVRLFFVISGFIIAERIGRESGLLRYLLHRYLRVLPLYALVTLIAFAITIALNQGLFTLARTDSGDGAFAFGALYLVKSLLVIPQDSWPFFMVGWSLEYEVVFYFLFGLAFFTLGRNGALLAMFGISIAAVLFTQSLRPALDPFFVYFLFGVLAREGYHHGPPWIFRLAPAGAIGGFALFIAHLYDFMQLPWIWGVLVSGGAFAALLLWVTDLERRGRAFGRRTIWVLIGDMSFSVYLIHWLIMPLSGYATQTLQPGPLTAEAIRAAAVLASLAVSWLVWRWIETPLHRRTRRLLTNRPAKTLQGETSA